MRKATKPRKVDKQISKPERTDNTVSSETALQLLAKYRRILGDNISYWTKKVFDEVQKNAEAGESDQTELVQITSAFAEDCKFIKPRNEEGAPACAGAVD